MFVVATMLLLIWYSLRYAVFSFFPPKHCRPRFAFPFSCLGFLGVPEHRPLRPQSRPSRGVRAMPGATHLVVAVPGPRHPGLR